MQQINGQNLSSEEIGRFLKEKRAGSKTGP